VQGLPECKRCGTGNHTTFLTEQVECTPCPVGSFASDTGTPQCSLVSLAVLSQFELNRDPSLLQWLTSLLLMRSA